MGWDRLVGDRIRVVDPPGEHLSIFKEPHVRHLAGEMDKVLNSLPEQSSLSE
jgi:thioesterase domain-containing protein